MHSVPRGARAATSGPSPLARALRYVGRYKALTVSAYASLTLASAAMLVSPFLTRQIIEQGIQAGSESVVVNLALLMVLAAVIGGVFTFLQGYLSESLSQSIAYDLRNALYEKIQRLSFAYHDRSSTGQLMTRATSDVDRLRMFLGQGFLSAINAVLLLTGITAILFALNWRLALVMMVILPLGFGAFSVSSRRIPPLFMRIQQYLDAFNVVLQENVAGYRVVKAFVRADLERQRFGVANTNLMAAQIGLSRTLAVMFPVTFLIANLGQVAILGFGGALAIGGTVGVGELVAFNSYLMLAFFPLGQLGFIVAMASQASASGSRVFEILDASSEVTDAPGAAPLPPLQGKVEFRGVSFRYAGSEAPVLRDVSFVVEPGQVVALLGATGSGKSSIISLVPRFYDATAGQILVDGHDVREVTLESLRSQIGIVLQETRLFSGTVRDNIAYGRPEASDDEVVAAAKAAAAHDFILSFPKGYDTPVAELGVSLSGGQKQRIAIARALLLDPRILILDDSTSSVDLQTEAQIQQALSRLMKGRTSFVIAQRISTARNADLIIVLDQGRVVASGCHKDLLESEPIYSDIYYSQLVEDVAAAPATEHAAIVSQEVAR